MVGWGKLLCRLIYKCAKTKVPLLTYLSVKINAVLWAADVRMDGFGSH